LTDGWVKGLELNWVGNVEGLVKEFSKDTKGKAVDVSEENLVMGCKDFGSLKSTHTGLAILHFKLK
jgi:hypothetical protein